MIKALRNTLRVRVAQVAALAPVAEALHARNWFLFAVVHKPVYIYTELSNAGCMIQLVVFAAEEEGAITHTSKAVISLLT
jgi:hypothetical protein